jgi:hypothetical protein
MALLARRYAWSRCCSRVILPAVVFRPTMPFNSFSSLSPDGARSHARSWSKSLAMTVPSPPAPFSTTLIRNSFTGRSVPLKMWQCASMINVGAEACGPVGAGQLVLKGGAFKQPFSNDIAAATKIERRETSSRELGRDSVTFSSDPSPDFSNTTRYKITTADKTRFDWTVSRVYDRSTTRTDRRSL